MSDDFGTVNLRRGERSREIEVLRGHYRRHREALVAMIDDAPTEHLAAEYQRIVAELDRSLAKLNELEGIPATSTAASTAPDPPRHPARTAAAAAAAPPPSPPAPTSPGMRPLAGTASDHEGAAAGAGVVRPVPASRLALIGAATLVALVAIGWLIWKASSSRGADSTTVVEEQPVQTTALETAAPEAVEPPTALTATPATQDYGVIRKGTRATRQFQIANDTDEPVTIQVARSACRCLYYQHAPVIPPNASETLTVTVDAAKAAAGPLEESLRITARSDPSLATTVELTATVR